MVVLVDGEGATVFVNLPLSPLPSFLFVPRLVFLDDLQLNFLELNS